MRFLICALLLTSSLVAQQYSAAPDSSFEKGTFYVDGMPYQYAVGTEYTVVAAVHSVINRKFAAVKVRIYNGGQHSVTIKPEDVRVEDAVAGRAVEPTSGAELARRMRKAYNMARLAVGGNQPDDAASADNSSASNQQLMEMMRAIAARSNQPSVPAGDNLLYTDTPGALDAAEQTHHAVECDQACRLRMGESHGADALAQLQRQNTPEYIEQCSLRSNTIPPHASVVGVLFYPLGKLAEEKPASAHMKKRRIVRVSVPVDDEQFQFVLVVE